MWDSLSASWRGSPAAFPGGASSVAPRSVINRLPAIFAVLLFGVPVVVMELGSFFSVVAIALGHVILGSICYGVAQTGRRQPDRRHLRSHAAKN